MKKGPNIVGVGLLTAITTSLCCIAPVLTIITGIAGVGSALSWLAPLRPYLIGLSILILGYAWYQKLRPKRTTDCNCSSDRKLKFTSTKTFLAIITIFATLTTTFPYYFYIFYPQSNNTKIISGKINVKTVDMKIIGMTCYGCEDKIKYEINKLPGVINSNVSYKNEKAVIQFDNTVTSINEIKSAINLTGCEISEFNYNN